jgi:predicted nucleic acid-binding protein
MNDKDALEFIDTNILVYAHDSSAGSKHERAKGLVKDLWGSQKGCLSIQVLQEFYVNVTSKVSKPLDAETAKLIMTALSSWRVHAPVIKDVLSSIDLHLRYGISFWDAMILQSAAQLGCQVVWSEDLNPGQVYDGLHVLNPFLD